MAVHPAVANASTSRFVRRALLSLPDGGHSSLNEFAQTLWISCAALVAHTVLKALLLPSLKKGLLRTGRKGRAEDVFNNAFTCAEYLLIESFGVYVTLTANGGCTPWSLEACSAVWPDHPSILQKWYLLLQFHHLLHELVGPYLGVGSKLTTDMFIHHIITLSYIVMGSYMRITKWGVVWLALYGVAAPFNYGSRALRAAGLPQFKWLEQTLLLIFTSLFFVGRILMAPAKYIPTYQYHHRMEPQAGAHTLLVIISLVFMLQVYWFSLLLTRISNMVRPSARAKAQHMVAVVLQRSPSGVH